MKGDQYFLVVEEGKRTNKKVNLEIKQVTPIINIDALSDGVCISPIKGQGSLYLPASDSPKIKPITVNYSNKKKKKGVKE